MSGLVRLHALAHARAGDKGDTLNVAVIPYEAAHFDHLVRHVTEEAVAALFAARRPTAVRRYLLPRLPAMNLARRSPSWCSPWSCHRRTADRRLTPWQGAAVERGAAMAETGFPVVKVRGTPFEVGRAYGEACRERIEAAFAYYGRLFRDDSGVAWDEVRAMGAAGLPLVERHDPDSMAEMAGIAEATGRGLDEVMALHMKTEIRIRGEARAGTGRPEGCTTLAALPEATADGHTIVGKNWDWTCSA